MNVSPAIIECRLGDLELSTDPRRVDVSAVHDMLSRSYWAAKRTRGIIEKSIANSIVFGVYDGVRQVAFARVVSDRAVFAWLGDVIVHEDYRGRGVGKFLMETISAHPELQTVRRFVLATNDAHGLYRQYGFLPMGDMHKWMERFNPEV